MSPEEGLNTAQDPDAELAARPFTVSHPSRQKAPVVFASPHSGDCYPRAFVDAARLDPVALRRSEDAFIDRVYAAAPDHGAPLLCARFPRAYVDPNREQWELDPAMFAEPLPDYVNSRSPRVAGGLGTVARVVTSGDEIYKRPLSFAEVRERIETYYVPYHGMMQKLVDTTVDTFGGCLLIDCHSMPSIGGPMDRDPGFQRVDMVLGDCHGASCSPAVTDMVQRALEAEGYKVRRNTPYAGGYTTHSFGRSTQGIHAIQIEINRTLYMDELRIQPGPGLAELTEKISRVIERICEQAADTMGLALPQPETMDSGVRKPCPELAVRVATESDITAVQAIYAHHVTNSVSSFEETPPNLAEMRARHEAIVARKLPYLVATCGGEVVGFAYAGFFRPRSAYRYTVENSVYVHPDSTGLGLGRMLMDELIEHCTALGYRQMVAVIGGGASNAASVALHTKLGFTQVGHLPSAGFKFGKWVDTVIMQRALGDGSANIPS